MASVLILSRTGVGIGWTKNTASYCSLEESVTDVSSAMVRKFCVLCLGVGVEDVGRTVRTWGLGSGLVGLRRVRRARQGSRSRLCTTG
jgi:hypothetical protein